METSISSCCALNKSFICQIPCFVKLKRLLVLMFELLLRSAIHAWFSGLFVSLFILFTTHTIWTYILPLNLAKFKPILHTFSYGLTSPLVFLAQNNKNVNPLHFVDFSSSSHVFLSLSCDQRRPLRWGNKTQGRSYIYGGGQTNPWESGAHR